MADGISGRHVSNENSQDKIKNQAELIRRRKSTTLASYTLISRKQKTTCHI